MPPALLHHSSASTTEDQPAVILLELLALPVELLLLKERVRQPFSRAAGVRMLRHAAAIKAIPSHSSRVISCHCSALALHHLAATAASLPSIGALPLPSET